MISGSEGVSHNGIFRGKDLGTISNLNEYLSFRSAHGVDDKSYKDLYLGDYFKIQDGTYNAVWMVAHFDYYYRKGDTASGRGVVLIPRTNCGESKMNDTNTTEGGYKATIANTTTCPAIASKLQTVLGSYLLSNRLLLSDIVNTSVASMAGAGLVGGATSWEWIASQCVLPNEIQIYGSMILSSSAYDIGEACEKLAVFNFINQVEYGRLTFWLRAVSNTVTFTASSNFGTAFSSTASSSFSLRPLIYIG